MDFPIRKNPDGGTRVATRDGEGVVFGNYRIFPELRLLLKNGNKVDLTARAFDVLWVLVKARGEVVTKDELIEQVWAGSIVEENNLQTHISAIRRALKQDRSLISTDFGRGYRLTLPAPARTNLPPATKKIESPNLPSPLTTLLGRDSELRDLQQLITANRLTTITGPGGIGKTRLAVEVGRRLVASFSGRVHLVEMGVIGERDNIWPAIARTLGVEAAGVGLTAESRVALQSQRLLLIIDSCEHLTEAVAGAVETLLQIGEGLHICITSQEPFGTQGEQIYRIRPLAVPPPDASTMDAVLAHAAAQLFVERSLSYTRDSQFDDATACEIATICRQLDGVPLALELAAARVPTLGVRGVLDGLSDRFRLLTAGQRNALPRHRTLRATVEWSDRLLDETERTLFRRLAVFPAGFTVEAAHWVSGPEIEDQWQVIDLLGNLVGKSLLHLDVSTPTPRYRFLETIRLYALEELADSGETDLTARRHASYFQRLGEQAVADWKRQSTGDWRRVHRGYVDDVRAALKWAFSENGDKEMGVRTLQNSIPFWMEFSLHDECRRWVSLALDMHGITETTGTHEEMILRAALGRSLTWARGPVAETGAALSRALDLARKLGDTPIELQAQYGLWIFNLRRGRYSEALRFATEMMTHATEAKDNEAFATAQRIAGVSRHSLGDHAEGRVLIERALIWFEENRPQSVFRFGLDQHAAGLAFLARILWVQGYTTDAVKTAHLAVERALALDHASTLCCVLAEGLCTVSALNEDLDALEKATQDLTREASRHGLELWKAYAEIFKLWAKIKSSSGTTGSEDLSAVIRLLDKMQFDLWYTPFVADVLRSCASPAGSMWASFRPSVDCEDRHWAMPEFLRIEADFDLEHNAGRIESTVEHRLESALALAHESGARSWELRVAVTLARLLIGDNRRDKAQILLRSTISSFPSGKESDGLRTAHALLNELQHLPSRETPV